jgi:hypothetical protein
MLRVSKREVFKGAQINSCSPEVLIIAYKCSKPTLSYLVQIVLVLGKNKYGSILGS